MISSDLGALQNAQQSDIFTVIWLVVLEWMQANRFKGERHL